MLDLFGEEFRTSESVRNLPERRVHRYRVLCIWLSEAGELLGQVSRELSHTAAKKLWGRVLRGDSDVLDAVMFNANDPMPPPDGVRLLGALDARELVRIDPDNLFDLVTRARANEASENAIKEARTQRGGTENDD